MYITEVKSTKNGKSYKTVLIRESYRDESGKVKNKTLANLSKLPNEVILFIKSILKKEKSYVNLAELQRENNREYGASFALMKLAQQIGLDRLISSTKSEWRDNVMVMIIGRILYQGSKLSLVNRYKDTMLWELFGHKFNQRPDVEKHCYFPMDELLKRKPRIERKLAKKHLSDGCIILYDITNIWFEGKYKNSPIIVRGKGKGGKVGYKQVAIGLLTDKRGCPVGVQLFKGNVSDQKTVLEQIKRVSSQYGIKHAIFTGDRGMLTAKIVKEISETDFKIITALTHSEMRKLIEKNNIPTNVFDEDKITEVIDSTANTRYMLCKNEKLKLKEGETRNSLISKVSELLNKKAAVTRKRDPKDVAVSIGRIFEKYKIGKFFNFELDERGGLTWILKQDKIDSEKELDGAYIIKTTAASKLMNKKEIVIGYRNLQKVEQAFKNMKTILLELRPVYHKNDKRIEAHVFIVMLAYYLQWHAVQRLKPLLEPDKKGKNKRWTFELIIERLCSITSSDYYIKGVKVKTDISVPDQEQNTILELLKQIHCSQ
jgi:transposase